MRISFEVVSNLSQMELKVFFFFLSSEEVMFHEDRALYFTVDSMLEILR